ncbi:MAG TPA: hypothetical protein VGN60_01960 [Devosia sp.]|jgi:hypothetical protein|nr:hypothetical protein [Devosia sp.]
MPRENHPGATVGEIEEFLDLLRQLPDDKREWFVGQMRLMDADLPNAIEGTAPGWHEPEGNHVQ